MKKNSQLIINIIFIIISILLLSNIIVRINIIYNYYLLCTIESKLSVYSNTTNVTQIINSNDKEIRYMLKDNKKVACFISKSNDSQLVNLKEYFFDKKRISLDFLNNSYSIIDTPYDNEKNLNELISNEVYFIFNNIWEVSKNSNITITNIGGKLYYLIVYYPRNDTLSSFQLYFDCNTGLLIRQEDCWGDENKIYNPDIMLYTYIFNNNEEKDMELIIPNYFIRQ